MGRRLSGKIAQARGKSFEIRFQNVCKILGVEIQRIPDGCRQVGRRIVRTKTPFDFVLAYKQRSAFIDVKTTKKNSFSFSEIVPHQLEALKKMSAGGVAGYIICFPEQIYFVDVAILSETKPGESINLIYANKLGNVHFFDIRKIF